MRILHLTAGTGSFFCGTCLRDNALVRGLQRLGHEAVLQPLYLPILAEGVEPSPEVPLRMGGVGVYLDHAVPLYRALPHWVRRAADHPAALRAAARRASSTRPEQTAALTLEMLRGIDGTTRRSIDDLVGHLVREARPDLIVLSNGLLAGLAPRLREALGAPVIATLQGETHYLMSMGEVWRPKLQASFGEALAQVDGLLAVSACAKTLTETFVQRTLPHARVVQNGVDLASFDLATPGQRAVPQILHIARMTPAKGQRELLELVARLHSTGQPVTAVLGGTVQPGDMPFVESLRAHAASLGIQPHVEFHPNLTPEHKRALLADADLFVAPTQKAETGGLYVFEALASGLPVVALDRGVFAEMSHLQGLTVCASEDLDTTVVERLASPTSLQEAGRDARHAAEQHLDEQHMARRFWDAIGPEGLRLRP